MVLSTLTFSMLSAGIKYLRDFPTFQLIFFRGIGSLFLATYFLKRAQISLRGNSPKWLLIRAFCGLISMGLFFASLNYLPLGAAVPLRYVAPIFATFFAVYLLKETVYRLQIIFIGIAFVGILILKGFDSQLSGIGFGIILSSAFFSGLVYIIIRKIGKSEHPLVIVNYFMAVSTLVGLIFALPQWVWPQDWTTWVLLGSLGVFGFVGQLYMTRAFQIAATNKIAPLKYLEGIFALLLGWFWFEETYSIYTLSGVGLILIGLTLNTTYKPLSKGRPLR